MPFSSFFQSIIPLNIKSVKPKVRNNKKKTGGQTVLSYYGLSLLDYPRTNKLKRADDPASIREGAAGAAER